MKCPKCQSENPQEMKFCGECGEKFKETCPKCNFANPPRFKFCGECGHELTSTIRTESKELIFEERLNKLKRYLPERLSEKILCQKEKIEGERRHVTVMFCDMEGSTPLVEQLGSEEAYNVIEQVYEILIRKVHAYEGTVIKMTGDGIMALFGAPIALEDAPQRSIRSATAIHREIALFNDRAKERREEIPPLKMRIGIHTGLVVVGTVGDDLRVQFDAVGDTVNVASRIEGLANPGATYVTEEVFRLTEGLFRFEALGEKRVKGKEKPVKVYRVLAPSSRRTKFDVSAERGLTPLVSRERELALLLDGFERAKAGSGKAFSIVGEAGVGKSRLLYEFRKAVTHEYITFLEGKCLSYSRGVAYHPVIDILKSNFDIQEGDDDATITQKVRRALKILGADEAATLPYLLEVLSVKESGMDKLPMSAEAKKDRIIEALKRIVLKGSEIRPLIMAFEDLHWMDTSSQEVLRQVLESIPAARVLLVFTYRPEYVQAWVTRSYHSQLTLSRLTERESCIMAARVLTTADLEPDLAQLIFEKTEGVPFYIEEFVRSLKDFKLIRKENETYCLSKDVEEVKLPATIHDVIMARVDSLPDSARETIQVASAIEREFTYPLLKEATGFAEHRLVSDLSILRDAELIYERGIFPETVYIFRHALTRDVVYDSILTKRRKRLHEEIGNAIERLYQKNLDPHYGLLASHYMTSENYEKGAHYSQLAADKAEKTGAMTDAIDHSRKRVDCLEKLPQTEGLEKRIIDARTALGAELLRMLYYQDARDAVAPIIDLAVETNYREKLPSIFTITGNYEVTVKEDILKAFDDFEKAISIAEELGDYAALGLASYRMGLASALNCEFEKSARHFQKALDIMVKTNILWGMSAGQSYLSTFCYFFWGRIKLAHRTSKEAVRLAEESGDNYSKAMAYTSHGCALYGKGFMEEATKYFQKGIDLCEKIDYAIFNAVARYMLAQLYHDIGNYENAKNHYLQAIRILKNCGALRSWMTFIDVGLTLENIIMKKEPIDLNHAYSHVQDIKLKYWRGATFKHIGEILLALGSERVPEAENWIAKAIQTLVQDNMQWYAGKAYALYADLLERKGDKLGAREKLLKAIETFEECDAEGWVRRYGERLATL